MHALMQCGHASEMNAMQTTALVVFGSPDGLQAAYTAASDRRVLEVQLDEPSVPFGLKGAPGNPPPPPHPSFSQCLG